MRKGRLGEKSNPALQLNILPQLCKSPLKVVKEFIGSPLNQDPSGLAYARLTREVGRCLNCRLESRQLSLNL